MIVYYLGEQPKIDQDETFLCNIKTHRNHVISNISKLVVKPANASGGYGIMIGPKASKKEKDEMRKNIKKGDKIITMGGIYGTVQGLKEKNRKLVLKVDNNKNITINTTAVAGLAGNVNDEELDQG